MSKQLSVKQYFDQDQVKSKLAELIGENQVNYVTSVLQVVNGNSSLANADPKSIFNATIMAAVLGFPINNNLGLAYIVPYGNQAQFQIGWKGFVQLAIRSGHYRTINATPIYKGQLIKNDPLEGFEFDFNIPAKGEPIGYASKFNLKNGFEKSLFMTVEQIEAHGKKYSKTYSKDSSTWKKDFPGMALKTVIKLLISKWGPMSLEMQQAVQADQSVIKDYESQDFDYVDNGDSSGEAINAKFEDVSDVSEEEIPEDDELI